MTLTAEAITALAALAVDAEDYAVHDLDGIPHLIHKGVAKPLLNRLPDQLTVRTLSGVVDYLSANRDDLVLDDLTVIVTGPGGVQVVGCARTDGRRAVHLDAFEPDVAKSFREFLGRWMSVEDFVIGAQQRFRPGFGDLATMLQVVGNISQNDVRTVADDGVSQEVTAKQGVIKVQTVPLPSPCVLVPRRSFPEVELSGVPFVLRVRKGAVLPEVALFEADGGAWMVDATAKIATFIEASWAAKNKGDSVPFGVLA